MAAIVFFFWMILNGRWTAEAALLGAALAGAILVFMCRYCDWSIRKEMLLYRIFPRLLLYGIGLIWEIVKANLALCRLIYTGRPQPVIRVFQTELKTALGKMLLANSITLTPGTVTLDVKDNELTVHCLTPDMAKALDHTAFEKRLRKMEALIGG